jgi:hypothetical protein
MSDSTSTSAAACGCHNLDDSEVRKRKVTGHWALIAAFALVAASKLHELPKWIAALPAIPFFLGYLNLLQARTRTCVMLAFMERDMSQGTMRQVSSRALGRRLKKRSVKLILAAGLLAAISAALCCRI